MADDVDLDASITPFDQELDDLVEPRSLDGRSAPTGLVGASVDAPSPAPVEAAKLRPSWARRVFRVLGFVAILALLAIAATVPLTMRRDLERARRELATTEQAAAGARTARAGAEGQVAERARELTTREAAAVDAANHARAARAHLAATGVSEAEIFQTLDATTREVAAAEARNKALADAIHAQDELLERAKSCIDDATRALGRSAIAALSGQPANSGSGARCSGPNGGPARAAG